MHVINTLSLHRHSVSGLLPVGVVPTEAWPARTETQHAPGALDEQRLSLEGENAKSTRLKHRKMPYRTSLLMTKATCGHCAIG